MKGEFDRSRFPKSDEADIVSGGRPDGQLTALTWRIDDGRIRRHLKRVEQQLRARDLSSLPSSLWAKRARHLDQLQAYWRRGSFPRNHGYPGQYRPCFIDRDGRMCAVAHLLAADGQEILAGHIASTANYAYLEEMEIDALGAWVTQSGLSQEELAQIQPTYPCPEGCVTAVQVMFDAHIAFLAQSFIICAVLGIATAVVNIVAIVRRRWSMLLLASAFGLVLGASLAYLGISYSASLTLFKVQGSIPCVGAGVVDACHPGVRLALDQAVGELSADMLFLGFFIFLGSWLGLGKGIKPARFSLAAQATTGVLTGVIGVIGLAVLTLLLDGGRSISYGFDLNRFAIFILITVVFVGFLPVRLLRRCKKQAGHSKPA